MAQSFSTNLYNVANHYLRIINAPVTKNTLKENLEQNPYYPSLYSLSHVFGKYNIVSQAYKITEEDLTQFEPPFIAYCSKQNTGKDFVLVTKVTEEEVHYISNGNKTKKLAKAEFLKQWQKNVFVAEANEDSGEADYKSKLKNQKLKERKQNMLYGGVALLIGIAVYSFLKSSAGGNLLAASLITITKLLGVGIATLLLIYDIDKTNAFVKNICTAGKQTNCDAVLNSKAGKILGMGWGEVGFFYFASTTIFLLLPGLAFVSKMPWLAIAGTLAAPYIVFSIYYQWRVIKQWCPLCLAVQAVLLMELTWSIINFWMTDIQLQPINTGILLPIASCLLLPFCIWYLLKPFFIAGKAAPGYNAAYKRLLYNPETFNSLLQQQQTAPDGWQQLGINIGNPDAANTIIKVCNPYCGPCANAHPVLEEIVKQNKDVNVKVIFTATNNESDWANKPVKHLLAVAAKGNGQLTEQALDDWYLAAIKDYDVFATKYPMNGELKEQEKKLDLMKQWCDDSEITATPTIFINGRRLPETYSINELKNIF